MKESGPQPSRRSVLGGLLASTLIIPEAEARSYAPKESFELEPSVTETIHRLAKIRDDIYSFTCDSTGARQYCPLSDEFCAECTQFETEKSFILGDIVTVITALEAAKQGDPDSVSEEIKRLILRIEAWHNRYLRIHLGIDRQ